MQPPITQADLARLYGPTMMTHRLFECAHGGVGPRSSWIADTPTSFCTRRNCPSTGRPLPPVETDRAALPGMALLVCHGCLLNGRQPHSVRAGVAPSASLMCGLVACGHPLHVRAVSATVDAERWIAQGHQRLVALQSQAATARAKLPPAPTAMDRVYSLDHIDEPPVLTHNLFQCNHGVKDAEPTSWIADTVVSFCAKNPCREKRVPLKPAAADRTKLTGFALLTCPACLDNGRAPNCVRMNVCATDVERCAHTDCGAPLRIRAIVARGDIDRWHETGRRWLVERADRDAADHAAQLATIRAQDDLVAQQCTELATLDEIYALTSGRSLELGVRVATEWLERNHGSWFRKHADAAATLGRLLAEPSAWIAYAERCDFCNASMLLAAGSQRPQFCGAIRRHLLHGGAPTAGCGAESCTVAECAACRARPAAAAASGKQAEALHAAIPALDAERSVEMYRGISSVPALRDAMRGKAEGIVTRVASEFLQRQMTPGWALHNPDATGRFVSILLADDADCARLDRCSFCRKAPLSPGELDFVPCRPLETHLRGVSCGLTARCRRPTCTATQCATCFAARPRRNK